MAWPKPESNERARNGNGVSFKCLLVSGSLLQNQGSGHRKI